MIISRNGDRSFELSPGSLPDELIPDLRKWINSRIASPSAGTAVVLDYLRQIRPGVYTRGLQRAGQATPAFWVQISFSGCAGEAETSARVAAHWTAHWHRAEHQRIAEAYLIPSGLTPDSDAFSETEEMCFLPAGELGYLEYFPAALRTSGQPAFELDNAAAEARSDDPMLDELNASFGKYMTESRCRCQLCEPAFAGVAVE